MLGKPTPRSHRMRRAFAISRYLLVPAVAALALSGVIGCAEIPYEHSAVYGGISPDLVWDTTLEVVQRDFAMASVNRGRWTFQSRWRESLQPMRFLGERQRVEGRVSPEEGGEGYRVELRVVKQRNEEMEEPLESKQAKWGHEEADPSAALILLQKIESILRPYARERRGTKPTADVDA
jgi:hypothetical protein